MRARVAVVGAWHVHATDYLTELEGRPDVEVVGVWDADAARAGELAEAHSTRRLESLDEALGDGVDAVVVTTATAEHANVIRAAIAAGRNVFCEKVLVADPDEARELFAAARRRDVVLHVSMQRTAEPWVGPARELIATGELGAVVETRIRYQHGGSVEGWLPARFADPEQALGGVVIDLGFHGFYLSLLLHRSFPAWVQAAGTRFGNLAVEDSGVVLLGYGDGSMSVLESATVCAPYGRQVEVHGTAGTALLDHEEDFLWVCGTPSGHWRALPLAPEGPTPLAQFLLRIDGDAPALESAEHERTILRLTEIVSAAYASMRTGSRVELVDPAPASGRVDHD